MNKSLLFSNRGMLMVAGPGRLDLDLLYFFQKCKHRDVMKFCTTLSNVMHAKYNEIIFEMKSGYIWLLLGLCQLCCFRNNHLSGGLGLVLMSLSGRIPSSEAGKHWSNGGIICQ